MAGAALAVMIWSLHFALIYGFTALACARQMSGSVPWVVAAASLTAVLALTWIGVPAGIRAARNADLSDVLASGVTLFAVIAVLWEASSLLWIAACA